MKLKKHIIMFVLIFFSSCIFRMDRIPLWGDKTINEMIGYGKNQKLLVINCDDIGIHPAITDGAIMVMESGLSKSASIIVNDRNDEELKRIAKIAKENPQWGFGIHLSLNNEYQENYPWAPIVSKEDGPTLYNEKGLAWKSGEEVQSKVDPVEAEKEWEAQILKAKKFGIELSHIDSHMGNYFFKSKYPGSNSDGFRNAAITLAKKYKLPLVINTYDRRLKKTMNYMDRNKMIRPEMYIGLYDFESINRYLAYEGSFIRRKIVASIIKVKYGLILPFETKFSVKEDMKQRKKVYMTIIKNEVLGGINHILIHPGVAKAYDGSSIAELKNKIMGLDGIIRVSDMEIWTSVEMKNFIEEQNIKIINYKQLKGIQEKV